MPTPQRPAVPTPPASRAREPGPPRGTPGQPGRGSSPERGPARPSGSPVDRPVPPRWRRWRRRRNMRERIRSEDRPTRRVVGHQRESSNPAIKPSRNSPAKPSSMISECASSGVMVGPELNAGSVHHDRAPSCHRCGSRFGLRLLELRNGRLQVLPQRDRILVLAAPLAHHEHHDHTDAQPPDHAPSSVSEVHPVRSRLRRHGDRDRGPRPAGHSPPTARSASPTRCTECTRA